MRERELLRDGRRHYELTKLFAQLRSRSDVIEAGDILRRCKIEWERLYPSSKHGAAPGDPEGGKRAKATTVGGFVRTASDETGISESTLRNWMAIYIGLSDEARDLVRGSKLASSTRALLKIITLEPDAQLEVIGALSNHGPRALTAELDRLFPRSSPTEPSPDDVDQEDEEDEGQVIDIRRTSEPASRRIVEAWHECSHAARESFIEDFVEPYVRERRPRLS